MWRPRATSSTLSTARFIFEPSPLHCDFVAVLARKLGARVTVPVYPLAPEHKPVAMYDMPLQALYDKTWPATKDDMPFVDHGRSHSTGATLFQSESHAAGQWMPGLNAYFDGTMTSPDLFFMALEKDPTLSLNGVARDLGGLKRQDTRITTINGTIKGPSCVFVTLGTDDMLYPDAELLVQKAKQNGCDVTFILGEGLFHIWKDFSFIRSHRGTASIV